jgi:hypothetical protein
MLTLTLTVTNDQAEALAGLLHAAADAAVEVLSATGPDLDPDEEDRLTRAVAVTGQLRFQCRDHLARCAAATEREAAALRPRTQQDIIKRGRAILLARRGAK